MRAILCLVLLVGVSPAFAAESQGAGQPNRPPELKQALDVAVSTTIAVELLKRTFQEPRPEGSREGGYAFPSGHAAAAFALAEVAAEYHPEQKWLWYVLAAGVAWSRVECDAHYWHDVIAGAAVGAYLGDITVDRGGLVLKQWEW